MPSSKSQKSEMEEQKRNIEEVDQEGDETKVVEDIHLVQLPNMDHYERSYMHKETVTHTIVTRFNFIVTTSADGYVKFWKKIDKGIEFVKNFRAHTGTINGIALSKDETLLATFCGSDKSIKIFDVNNFDMINMIKLNFEISTACWIFKSGNSKALLACSDKQSSDIKIFDAKEQDSEFQTVKLHNHSVCLMAYSEKFNTVISADIKGIVEYWTADSPHKLPKGLKFKLKSETDLYEFAKNKSRPTSIQFNKDESLFVTMATDRQVRIFRFVTGKLYRKYDESIAVATSFHQNMDKDKRMEDIEFGKRVANERELEKTTQFYTINAIFDESNSYILYPSLFGIKVVNIASNKLSRIIGKADSSLRFLNISLYQGAPKQQGQLTMAMLASDNPNIVETQVTDPTIFATSFKTNRFYLFSRRTPLDKGEFGLQNRDIQNEKIIKDDSAANALKRAELPRSAVVHTDLGDIFIELYPQYAPKAVENFVTHSKNGYYDNCIFHRVIKDFMIQTGDPEGNGTGGVSIWGEDFEDEFDPALKHDKPFVVSMANSGPNTNGSQFFITVRKCPWLDMKHTIFGRCTGGYEVVTQIENLRTNIKTDIPLETVKICNVSIK
ncbi:peptidyl-prolyl cis-trans isomerase cyp15 [Rozella allomycis CSF55]|uniref:peptidylprolyl isomerase n=1 Tax=Rozella allomycis (strain CSF55) TaxID=988480 RepID=A0A4P9YI87_ROZAC|nr:peptidyl-prolyl cis-trans isomerase cyp15 [Rozella allomycis CSF55]